MASPSSQDSSEPNAEQQRKPASGVASVPLTPAESAMWGLGIFATGALGTGFLTIVLEASRKRAGEDAVEAAARIRAVPVAMRALGISTVACATVAATAFVGMQQFGVEAREVTHVASIADAISVARQARDVTQREFKRRRDQQQAAAAEGQDSHNSGAG